METDSISAREGVAGNGKHSEIEALVFPDGILLHVYGDIKLARTFGEILSKYGLRAVKKFCSPCG